MNRAFHQDARAEHKDTHRLLQRCSAPQDLMGRRVLDANQSGIGHCLLPFQAVSPRACGSQETGSPSTEGQFHGGAGGPQWPRRPVACPVVVACPGHPATRGPALSPVTRPPETSLQITHQALKIHTAERHCLDFKDSHRPGLRQLLPGVLRFLPKATDVFTWQVETKK